MNKYFLCVIIFFFIQTSWAQTVKGKIINHQKKPIESAYIFHQKSGNHEHTNTNGEFTFENISKGDTLKISHIGYENTYIVIDDFTKPKIIELNDKTILLNEVTILPKINALNLVTKIDIQTNPVNSSQEVLRKVPGLIIGQHAGGGKAEQIFLRGFDIDHGTDINIMVDDIPVNMVSHAHGQGYADLHFLIPETIDKIDFGKGTYYANKGNFATAGYVTFETKENIKENTIKVEAGKFDYSRILGLLNLLNTENETAYLASEYILTDGPFESPQNFSRINLMGKYTSYLKNNNKINITVSHFTSKWDASGQIPQRAVNNGLISRFGAIDDTEGGKTSRSNVLFNYKKSINDNSFIKNSVFYSKYDFELYSNFTFYLDDPENGDQIKQKESRDIYGFKSEYNKLTENGDNNTLFQAAIGFRNDQIKSNELSHTLNRKTTLNNIALGDVDETNFYSYINTEISLGKWVINPALRLDYFKFNYNDALVDDYKTQSENKAILSPKLNFLYNYSTNLQLYLKTGKGFHSNDTRVVVAENGKEILPAAYSADVGFIWKPTPKLLINSALWYLHLDQEFVYVGDAGIVEPSGKTERKGVDFGVRYQVNDWIYFNTDINYTHARAKDEPNGEDYIPLAPDLTICGGIHILHPSGFYGGIDYRHIKDRPANEDNSIEAEGYFITDINAGYKWNDFDFGITIENLFDNDWNETQFATESRLYNEPESVEEIHFIPGTPFNLKGYIRYIF